MYINIKVVSRKYMNKKKERDVRLETILYYYCTPFGVISFFNNQSTTSMSKLILWPFSSACFVTLILRYCPVSFVPIHVVKIQFKATLASLHQKHNTVYRFYHFKKADLVSLYQCIAE